MERVDDRLPLIGRTLDVRVLEAPGEHVLDQVVGGRHVPGLPDSYADGLVAQETHKQELVVTGAEEPGQAAEDTLHIHVLLRPHQLPDDGEQIAHDLVLTIAQGIVFEEVDAHGETVFQVLDPEHPVDRLVQYGGEGGQLIREQFGRRRRLGLGDEGVDPARRQVGEDGHDGLSVGELGFFRHGPLGDAQSLGHPVVAKQ